MTVPNYVVRRATIEDLPKLITLWQQEQLPVEQLGKRCLEFQVAEGPQGELVGAIGFRVEGQEGQLRDEAFAQPEHADALRARLWERLQTVIKNHGLHRVWTTLPAPFWHAQGFVPAPEDMISKLPTTFAERSGQWQVMRLREDVPATLSIDQEFAMFKQAEEQSVQRIYRQAKVAKTIAVTISILVVLLVLIWAFIYFRYQATPRN